MHPSEEELEGAAQIIRRGGLVAFPTETVYGLGANALDANAVRRIFEAKGRPWASPVIVHVADERMARTVAADWPATAHQLATTFWPGPLTIVIRKASIVPDVVTAGLDSVGIRVPDHRVAQELIRRSRVPIAAPSANRFSEISPTTAEHVRVSLDNRVDAILDGGPTRVGIESTVITLHRNPPAVLRPGMISKEELERVSGMRFEVEVNLPRIIESPGQYPRHYAPRTKLYLLEPNEQLPEGRGRVLEMPDEPKKFAEVLYAELHRADGENWDWIGIKRPPETSEWTGIIDRLRRASAQLA